MEDSPYLSRVRERGILVSACIVILECSHIDNDVHVPQFGARVGGQRMHCQIIH